MRGVLLLLAVGCGEPAPTVWVAGDGPVEASLAGGDLITVSSIPAQPVAGEAVTLAIDTDWSVVEVTPWMPDHGHGISETPTLVEVDGGVEAGFAYSMPGYWEVTIVVDDGSQSEDLTIAWTVE